MGPVFSLASVACTQHISRDLFVEAPHVDDVFVSKAFG